MFYLFGKRTVVLLVVEIILLAHGYPARGTSILAIHLGDRIVIAADSRVIGDQNDDRYCKIRNFQNRMVLVNGGFLGISNLVISDEVLKLVRGRIIHGESDLKILLDDWDKEAIKIFSSIRQQNPYFVLSASGEAITIYLLIVATVDNGPPVMGVGTVIMNKEVSIGTPLYAQQSSVILPAPQMNHPAELYALEYAVDTEAIVEQGGAGFKSKAEMDFLREQEQTIRSETQMKIYSDRFTALAGNLFPDAVGGPTDEITIGREGIRWIRVKDRCRAIVS
jgi:hypothetical protein